MKLIDILQEVKITRSPKIGTGRRPLPSFIILYEYDYGLIDRIEPYIHLGSSAADFTAVCEDYSRRLVRSYEEDWDGDPYDINEYMVEFNIGQIDIDYSGACRIPTGEESKVYLLDVKEFPEEDIRLLLGDYTTYSPELLRRVDTFIDNLRNSFD